MNLDIVDRKNFSEFSVKNIVGLNILTEDKKILSLPVYRDFFGYLWRSGTQPQITFRTSPKSEK